MVILPLVPQFSRMLQRNLLYTAVTRAEKMLILLGDVQSFERSVTNESVNRQTTLTKRLQQVFGGDSTSEAAEPTTTGEQSVGAIDSDETGSVKKNGTDSDGPTDAPVTNTEPTRSTILTPALVSSGQIDPMIGMNGITPANFMPQVTN